ncbi:unnamed protein product, partial [Symbiodinium microadriaticum]
VPVPLATGLADRRLGLALVACAVASSEQRSGGGFDTQRATAEFGRKNALEELESLRSELGALRKQFEDRLPPPNAMSETEEQRLEFEQLEARYSELRERARENEMGDPWETWTVPQHECSQPLVRAHSAVTRGLFEVELAKLTWMSHVASDPPELAQLLVQSSLMHLRLMEVSQAYTCLQAAIDLGV